MKRFTRFRIIKLLLIIAIVLITGYFFTRNFILAGVIERMSRKLENQYGLILKIPYARFSGFSTIEFRDLSLAPVTGDSILKADTILIKPSFASLIIGSIKINELNASGLQLQITNHVGELNTGKTLKPISSGPKSIRSERDLARLASRVLRNAFDLAPQVASLKDMRFIFENDSSREELLITEFISSPKSIEGNCIDKTSGQLWKLTGSYSQREQTFDIAFIPDGKGNRHIPILKNLFGVSSSLDTFHVVLNNVVRSRNNLQLKGKLSAENFELFHNRISDDTIRLPHFSFDFSISVTPNAITVDSVSQAVVGDLRVRPYLRYQTGKNKDYTLFISTDTTPATLFFNSLPEGMFDEVRSIKANGFLQYSLRIHLNAASPDSVYFSSVITRENFRIRDFGSSGLLKMNGEFTHDIYEKGRYIRSIVVGPSNMYFTKLEDISPYFRNSVMTSEDGSFFFHNGFNEEAFRQSIATNFKAGKFVRGGSTISMQLVKNVFLNRKKTIARKAEEALLVWLIESQHLCPKERMFEVYLNIIELGPDVYGIGEAASFYFNKKPSELNLPESIFLASLLPRPKAFKYSFDEQGNLKPYLADYYRVVSKFMLRKNLITQDEFDHLIPAVELQGAAKSVVVPVDTLQTEDTEPDM